MERAQAALGGLVAEAFIEAQDAHEIALGHRLGDLLVEDGAFGREAIGAVVRELVREIATRDEHHATIELVCCLRDELAEVVMLHRSVTRQARRTTS